MNKPHSHLVIGKQVEKIAHQRDILLILARESLYMLGMTQLLSGTSECSDDDLNELIAAAPEASLIGRLSKAILGIDNNL